MHARWKNPLLMVSLAASLGACAATQPTSPYRSGVASIDRSVTRSVVRTTPETESTSPITESAGRLTFDRAWSLVLSHNPELAAAAMEVDWHDAMVRQSGALPNPEIEMTAENFGGSSETSGFGSAETTLQIAQTIELGGKRAARRESARDERRAVRLAFADERLSAARDARLAYVEVARAQRSVENAADRVDAAREAAATLADDAAAVAAARVETRQVEIELRHARAELKRARHDLAAMWGNEPEFTGVVDTLDQLPALPPIDELLDRTASHPHVAAARAAVAAAETGRDLARAEAVPDLTPSFGARRFHESDETAFVVGLSLPLPLFDRRSGERRAAQIRVRQAREALRSAEIEVRNQLVQAHEALAAARNEAEVLRNEILPDARQAFDDAADSHRHGMLGRPVVLSAKQAWREVEARTIDALAECQRWRAEVDRWSRTSVRY